jgi:polysaccharide pyruvyl transferase WcaK-like protein
MSEPRKIAIITRLDNTNAGNEALSTELLNLAAEFNPGARIMAVNRYPRYFEHLTLSRMGSSKHSVTGRFDQLASSLFRKFYRAQAPLPSPYDHNSVTLRSDVKELRPGIRTVKNFVGFRRNLARFGLIERDEVTRTVSLCGQVDLLLWNPAGEFHPTGNPHQTFRILLMIRMAQMMNVSTAVVNHSLEISDDVLREVVGHVYRSADYVCVRDPRSRQILNSLGVAPEKISESPDLVFLVAKAKTGLHDIQSDIPEGAVGLAINGAEARRGVDEWDSLLEGLRKLGRPIVFVSNAMNGDLEFGSKLMEKCAGSIIDRQPSYLELREMYRRMSVLISSRLHASILALCADTPVVTIEPSVFKLTAILQQLDYPIATDTLSSDGWSDRVMSNVESAISNRQSLVGLTRPALERQVSQIYLKYRPICLAAASSSRANAAIN